MCDTLVVRADGGVLFAANSDRDPNGHPGWVRTRTSRIDAAARSAHPCPAMVAPVGSRISEDAA